MIDKVTLLLDDKISTLSWSAETDAIVNIDLSECYLKPFDCIEIHFKEEITLFRNYDYTWAPITKDRIAGTFSTKAIQFKSGVYMQPNCGNFVWEISLKNPKKMICHLNNRLVNPMTNYYSDANIKKVTASNQFNTIKNYKLLFSSSGIVELSRSKIPFVATACFTDHCDFDTLESIQMQRAFFKDKNIKVTKGFFLNHFSKRADNASWEKDSEELQKWIVDGHELCYHSLSQSIKSKQESENDFFSFSPPVLINTWIDHGYQPYNLSMHQKEGIESVVFSDNLAAKKISVLSNYIDSGTATSGVLNQLNSDDFTLQSFYNGIKKFPLKKRIPLFIKNAIVHFYADENLIKNYSQLASSYKKINQSKSIAAVVAFIGKLFGVAIPLLKIGLFWGSYKKKVYPLAKYQNLFFEHTIGANKFVIFQTVELLDFINSLNQKSIDKLLDEKGMFVAHTYFSVPMEYHNGRIFTKSGEIHPKVDANFDYLGQNIKENKIWNPTLKELVSFWKEFNTVELTLDENGAICIKNKTEVPHRIIT